MKNIVITMLMLLSIVISQYGCNSTSPSSISASENISSFSQQIITNSEQQKNRIELVYFHLAQRCITCLCFEERFNIVLKEYFIDQMKSGKLLYIVAEIGKPENDVLVKKYQAYGSQLFINSIVDNKDNIREIKEIWSWKCPSDKKGFDEKFLNFVTVSLADNK